MTVLVTGSAGFIGFHLARRLLEAGEEVVGLDNMNSYYDVALKQARHAMLARFPGFSARVMNLADLDGLRALVRATRPRVVFHLAAQAGVRHALKAPADYVSSNITGSFHLLEACREAPPAHILLASTSSAYGATGRIPFREDDAADTPLSIYAASKRAMEVIGHSHAHLHGVPVTAFRFFTVYGPWGRPDMALFRFTRAILAGEPIELHNHGRMERDFTYVEDLVSAILALSRAVPRTGHPASPRDTLSPAAPYRVVNIGRGSPVPLLDFVAAIERAAGRAATRIRAADGTVTTVPNSNISRAQLTNISARPSSVFQQRLSLPGTLSPDRLERLVAELRRRVAAHPLVENGPGQPRVRASGFGAGGELIEIEVFARVLTKDGPTFQDAQEALVLDILRALEAAGITLAAQPAPAKSQD